MAERGTFMENNMMPTHQINYVGVVFGKIMIRMNTQTGKTWEFKSGVWLPVKEEK